MREDWMVCYPCSDDTRLIENVLAFDRPRKNPGTARGNLWPALDPTKSRVYENSLQSVFSSTLWKNNPKD